MSVNEATMDEKYFDLQNKLIASQLDAINKTLDNFSKDVKKVLDDHETRLRDQAKTEAINAHASSQAINTLQMEIKDLRQENGQLSKKLEEFVKERADSAKKELSLWQTVALELARVTLFGAGGGGVIIGLIKLFGINL